MDEEERKKKVSTDVSRETLDRGMWDTFMRTELQALREFVRAQNPFAAFYWDSDVALADDDYLDTETGLTPTAELGGWIPLRNGFFAGVTLITEDPTALGANTGIKLVIERNGVQQLAEIYLTDEHNFTNPSGNAGGAKHTVLFNMNPSGTPTAETQNAFQFKADERITIRAENDLVPGLNWSELVKKMNVYLYYTFDVPTPESFSAMRLAGGGLPGGETGGGDNGNGGVVT